MLQYSLLKQDFLVLWQTKIKLETLFCSHLCLYHIVCGKNYWKFLFFKLVWYFNIFCIKFVRKEKIWRRFNNEHSTSSQSLYYIKFDARFLRYQTLETPIYKTFFVEWTMLKIFYNILNKMESTLLCCESVYVTQRSTVVNVINLSGFQSDHIKRRLL